MSRARHYYALWRIAHGVQTFLFKILTPIYVVGLIGTILSLLFLLKNKREMTKSGRVFLAFIGILDVLILLGQEKSVLSFAFRHYFWYPRSLGGCWMHRFFDVLVKTLPNLYITFFTVHMSMLLGKDELARRMDHGARGRTVCWGIFAYGAVYSFLKTFITLTRYRYGCYYSRFFDFMCFSIYESVAHHAACFIITVLFTVKIASQLKKAADEERAECSGEIKKSFEQLQMEMHEADAKKARKYVARQLIRVNVLAIFLAAPYYIYFLLGMMSERLFNNRRYYCTPWLSFGTGSYYICYTISLFLGAIASLFPALKWIFLYAMHPKFKPFFCTDAEDENEDERESYDPEAPPHIPGAKSTIPTIPNDRDNVGLFTQNM